MNRNEVYLQKKLSVVLPKGSPTHDNKALVATIGQNFQALGYAFSPQLFKALSHLNEGEITAFYLETLPVLKKMRGAHRSFNPMYPNFPKQVMEMSNFELYWNAMVHYWSFWMKDLGLTDEVWLPQYEKEERMALTDPAKYDMIRLGTEEGFESIFTALVEAKSSISEADKQVLTDFILAYRDDVVRLLPDSITTKEQLAYVTGLLLQHTKVAHEMARYVKTPTDVLRVAVGFVGGDVSLAEVTKFKKFSRPQRRFLLTMLEVCKTNLAEEMAKYQSRWVRLGEFLHPGEYATQYPRAFAAFKALRSDKKIETFNSRVEAALQNDVVQAVELLKDRPGDFARRLDHIFRILDGKASARSRNAALNTFIKVSDKVSTMVLLQLFTHFKTRGESDFRAVFPKGQLAKIHVLETPQVPIDNKFCARVADKIRQVLVTRFATLDKMGKVYVDEQLKTFLVPFSQRSASKALKTIVRGSQIPLDGDYDTIRFFVWWKNGNSRTDLDLTATILDENWGHKMDVAYYNLKDFCGCHSGDITDAPRGAAEFIDISLKSVVDNGGRYIVMGVYSFTTQPYCDLPECFAGWMGRKQAQSGEIFEAKTVKNKIDISSDTQVVLPMIIDAKERKVIWMDLGLKQRPTWNNAFNNRNNIALVCKAMSQLHKPNLYDLLAMHAEGRGQLVDEQSKADMVFSSENFPFDVDTILTKFI